MTYLLIETNGSSRTVVGSYTSRLKAEGAALEAAPYTFMKWRPEAPCYVGYNPYSKEGVDYPTYTIHKVVE